MMYQKYFNTRKGMILMDILVALSLGVLFISIITESSFGARNIFVRARERDRLMNMLDKASSTSKDFGNDRIETDLSIVSTSTSQPLSFVQVKSREYSILSDSIGTPICSVDFLNKNESSVIPSIVIILISLPINPLLPLTDLEVRNNIAYVSSDSTTSSDSDLFVFDIQDKNHPVVISQINTGPGLSSISLAGNHVYAAAASTAGQLHVIRMSGVNSPTSLTLEKKFQLIPPYATATQPFGTSIFFNRNKIYLGTSKWDGDEFNVFDVTNPVSPIRLSGLEIGTKINDIYVDDGTAYLADADEKQLRVLDVSNPFDPFLADSFSPSGGTRQEGNVLSYFEHSLNFGRTSGGFNITKDYEIFSWPAVSSSTYSLDISGGVYGIATDRSYIYLATRQIGKEFQIYDRSLATSTASYYSLPVAPQSITCDGDSLYILSATAPVIYEISFK